MAGVQEKAGAGKSTLVFNDKIEICESKIHGRGIRAKRDLKPGEVLMQEQPFSYVLCHEGSPPCCDCCFTDKLEQLLDFKCLKKCSGCNFVKYCDKKCQVAAWPDHKQECKAIKNSKDRKVISDDVRLLAKIQWKRKNLLTKPFTDSDGFPCIPDNLSSAHDKWGPVKKQRFEDDYQQLCHFMDEGSIADKDKMKQLYGIYKMNGQGLSNITNPCNIIGAALYLKTSMFNHDCDGNCDQGFINNTISEIRAIKHIKKGEECCIPYIPEYKSTAARRDELMANWYFTCNCALCQDKERDARICGVRCGSSSCSSAATYPPAAEPVFVDRVPMYKDNPQCDIKCVRCSWTPSEELRKQYWPAFSYLQKAKMMIDNMKGTPMCEPAFSNLQKAKMMIDNMKGTPMCDWKMTKTVAENALARGNPLFHRHSQMMKELTEEAKVACRNLQLPNEVLKYSLTLAEITREVTSNTPYHRGLGNQYAGVGVEYMSMGRSDEAAAWFAKALEIYDVAFGKDHQVTNRTRMTLSMCQMSL